MNRKSIVALSIAAVLGITGGTALALRQLDDDLVPSSTPSSTPSSSPSGSPSSSPRATPSAEQTPISKPSAEATLRYVTPTTVHDGDKSQQIEGRIQGFLTRMTPTDGGYLVSSWMEESAILWFVADDGSLTRLGDAVTPYAVNDDGTRFAVAALRTDRVELYDGANGKLIKTFPRKVISSTTYVTWHQDELLINEKDQEVWQLAHWTPASDKVQEPDDGASAGLVNATLSPDGRYLAGAVNTEGVSLGDENNCTTVELGPGSERSNYWNTCDWRTYGSLPFQFSPDSTKVLLVPAASDGFGPGLYAAVDSAKGPRVGVQQIDVPDGSASATWADNSSIWVVGSVNADPKYARGGFISRCTLDDKCSKVTDIKSEAVLADWTGAGG